MGLFDLSEKRAIGITQTGCLVSFVPFRVWLQVHVKQFILPLDFEFRLWAFVTDYLNGCW